MSWGERDVEGGRGVHVWMLMVDVCHSGCGRAYLDCRIPEHLKNKLLIQQKVR